MALEPVRITSSKTTERDTETLFYIDDEEFRIPCKVPPNVTLKFIRDMRAGQVESAVAKAFDNLIGRRAVDRLAECEALTEEQLAQIMGVIQAKMTVAADAMLGNS